MGKPLLGPTPTQLPLLFQEGPKIPVSSAGTSGELHLGLLRGGKEADPCIRDLASQDDGSAVEGDEVDRNRAPPRGQSREPPPLSWVWRGLDEDRQIDVPDRIGVIRSRGRSEDVHEPNSGLGAESFGYRTSGLGRLAVPVASECPHEETLPQRPDRRPLSGDTNLEVHVQSGGHWVYFRGVTEMRKLSNDGLRIDVDHRMPALRAVLENVSGLAACYLFGSYGTEWQTPLSDVDLALVYGGRSTAPTFEEELQLIGLVTEALGEDDVSVTILGRLRPGGRARPLRQRAARITRRRRFGRSPR
jgi:predicted nucleotidyltransferase